MATSPLRVRVFSQRESSDGPLSGCAAKTGLGEVVDHRDTADDSAGLEGTGGLFPSISLADHDLEAVQQAEVPSVLRAWNGVLSGPWPVRGLELGWLAPTLRIPPAAARLAMDARPIGAAMNGQGHPRPGGSSVRGDGDPRRQDLDVRLWRRSGGQGPGSQGKTGGPDAARSG